MEILEKVIANLGLILLGLLAIFVLVGIIKALRNRFAKNVFKLICVAGAIVATVFLTGFGIKKIMEIEFINDKINEIIAGIDFLKGSSVEFAKGAVIALVTALLTPLLFLICLFIVKFILKIVLIFFPFIRKAMKRKVDGKKVKTNPLFKLVGLAMGIVGSVACFAVVVGPILSVADMVTVIVSEVPEALIEEDNSSASTEYNGVRLYAEGGDEGGEEEKSDSLSTVVKYAGIVKKVTTPLSESFVYKQFKQFKLTDAFEGYLNKVSQRTFVIDGVTYETKAYTDFRDMAKSAVIIGSYYMLEQKETGLGAKNINDDKIGEAVYGLFKNGAVIDAVDPLLKNAISSLCEGSFGLNSEETQEVIDTIKLKDLLKATEETKKAECDRMSEFIVSLLDVLPALQNEGADMLDNAVSFGAVLDAMANTDSFGKTPGKLLKAFIKSNDTIQTYLSTDIINKLVGSVEEGKSSYTDYLISVKSSMNMAMTFAGTDLFSGESMGDMTSEQIAEKLGEDFKALYKSSNEAVKDVMMDVIGGAVNEIADVEGAAEAKNSLVIDYFDNLFTYADDLKKEAGDDPEKQKAAEETFAKEAEAIGSVVGFVDKLSSGEELTEDVVGELTDSVMDSVVLQNTVNGLNDSDDEANQQLKDKFNDVSDTDKANIENMLNGKIADAEGDEGKIASINSIKQLLGISIA